MLREMIWGQGSGVAGRKGRSSPSRRSQYEPSELAKGQVRKRPYQTKTTEPDRAAALSLEGGSQWDAGRLKDPHEGLSK